MVSWPFAKRCGLCRRKIEGDAYTRVIDVSEYPCEIKHDFCSKAHAEEYRLLIQESAARSKTVCCCDAIQPRRSES